MRSGLGTFLINSIQIYKYLIILNEIIKHDINHVR